MPIAFMVMPYGTRPTGITAAGVPQEIDFDRLWIHVYAPLLEELGYTPLRADFDAGSMVIRQMLQRLVLGDLVIADLTLPNSNVYYEVGVRHAARKSGCILAAADWSKTVFDVEQLRRFIYPLPEGNIDEETALGAREALLRAYRGLEESSRLHAKELGTSPVHEAVPGYPTAPDAALLKDLATLAVEHGEYLNSVRTAYLAPQSQQKRLAEQIVERQMSKPLLSQADAHTLITMARDLLGWPQVLELAQLLRHQFPNDQWLIEQRALASAKRSDDNIDLLLESVTELSALIERVGGTSERWGILGGRYKQLLRTATTQTDRDHYLERMINAYERGMACDLNDYYPACNLPALYRRRGATGDEEKADRVLALVSLACQRAIDLNTADEWVRQTMLGAAFTRGDVAEAARLCDEVTREGQAVWKLQSTINDLRETALQHAEPIQTRLEEILATLFSLVPDDAIAAEETLNEPVQIDNYAQIGSALSSMGLATGRPVVVVVGGASGLTPDVSDQLRALFGQVATTADRVEAAVIDGGTDAGVMRLMGQARRDARAGFPLVGVASRGTIQLPDAADEPSDAADLDLNHTHMLLVPGDEWGDESPWIARVATWIGHSHPSVTIVANGGEITYQDVERSLDEGRRVIVVAGTGRTADDIAAAAAGEPASPRAEKLARSPLVRVVDLDAAGEVIAESLTSS